MCFRDRYSSMEHSSVAKISVLICASAEMKTCFYYLASSWAAVGSLEGGSLPINNKENLTLREESRNIEKKDNRAVVFAFLHL